MIERTEGRSIFRSVLYGGFPTVLGKYLDRIPGPSSEPREIFEAREALYKLPDDYDSWFRKSNESSF